jgi:hypothetical protein
MRERIHQEAHAIYWGLAGFVPVLPGPVAFYDSENVTFDFGKPVCSAMLKTVAFLELIQKCPDDQNQSRNTNSLTRHATKTSVTSGQ